MKTMMLKLKNFYKNFKDTIEMSLILVVYFGIIMNLGLYIIGLYLGL